MNQTTPRCCRCNFFIPSVSPRFETSFGLLCMSCRREGAELRESEGCLEPVTKVLAGKIELFGAKRIDPGTYLEKGEILAFLEAELESYTEADQHEVCAAIRRMIESVQQWGKPILPAYDDGKPKDDPGWLARLCDEATNRTGTSVEMLTKPVKINVLRDAAGKITKVLPNDDEVHDDGGERESMPVGSRVFDTKHNRTGRVVSITEKKYWCQVEDSEECFTALEENLRLRDAATFHSFRDIGPATDVRDNIGNTTDGPGWVQDLLDASGHETLAVASGDTGTLDAPAMRDEYNKLPIPFLCPKCSNLIARTDGNKTLIAECPAGLHSLAMDADVRFECPCGHEWTWSPKT